MAGSRSRDPLPGCTVEEAVAGFGADVSEKLSRGGAPEDQLRGPLELLLKRVALKLGLDAVAYGEVLLKDIRARPDYAVDLGSTRVGYLEVKAPKRGVPCTKEWRPNKREREQWERLRALPNLIYTDGTSWAHYSFGECKNLVRLDGDLTNPRKPLRLSGAGFSDLVLDFLCWEPKRLTSLPELIRRVAGLCRLLRDEVVAILRGSPDHRAYEGLSLLAEDWRALLFPGLDDLGFADAYAQTIVFAMLLARLDGIVFQGTPLLEIGRQLSKKHLLIGRAFQVLLDSAAVEELRTIDTLHRIIGVVDFTRPKGIRPSIYVDLYEKFLAAYDPSRRKESGSYYTPEPVAHAMVDFVDQILRSRLERPWGFADDDVVVVDPAMGTGTFLVEVVQRVADTIGQAQGDGARNERLRELLSTRLVGFEVQVAPYAITELRIHQALSRFSTEVPSVETRFLTDALENPAAQQGRMGGAATWPLERSRQEANRFKREVPVMVVIGNPPHVENTKGQAPWIEQPRHSGTDGNRTRPSLDEFRTPGMGRYTSDLHGMPWLFWRWAIWKAFEAHDDHNQGVVAFIVPASLISSRAFAGVRRYLRSICDEGWVIELSPEGNRSKAGTRIFGAAVSRQLCIAVFSRSNDPAPTRLAIVRYLELHGSRQGKLARLAALGPDDPEWRTCRNGWEAPFLPEATPEWSQYPALSDIMPWRSRGITPGRSWIYAPDPDTLKTRWLQLITASGTSRVQLFKEGRDRKIDTAPCPLPGFPPASGSLSGETGPCPEPIPVAYRPFDRQWIIPDSRLMEMPRPPLWAVRSDHQIYVNEQDSHSIKSGPGLLFTNHIPDLDHFNGRGGGIRPLYRNAHDTSDTSTNIAPGLLSILSQILKSTVTASDLLSYMAAVTAHRGYTERFRSDLKLPGVRVPLTTEPELWAEAVELGRHLLWLHTFGEHQHDGAAGRPRGHRVLAQHFGIHNPAPISTLPSRSAGEITHDATSLTLHIGAGSIRPVTLDVWEYDVGGMRVIRHWLNYRTTEYHGRSSPLDHVRPQRWTAAMTDELLALTAVLTGCVALEDQQKDLLQRICTHRTVSASKLTTAGVLPPPITATAAPRLIRDPLTQPLLQHFEQQAPAD
ncbi:type ISP restriction/modification enzyme [Actinomadura syzygii]|uniref:site-specific DNA-methyltransferase (adenine-specific) n=1 Tax=Actinomadura syzygii TaxID=1427538 RepID=A0A5D0TVM9_9ACTN|nr:type ISP restriction/modification enzyme [Actinomadura syzygii]TYC10321.1 N-6 DNA methylase [Actinomadura syzygii]